MRAARTVFKRTVVDGVQKRASQACQQGVGGERDGDSRTASGSACAGRRRDRGRLVLSLEVAEKLGLA
jgi:hypothetical protein